MTGGNDYFLGYIWGWKLFCYNLGGGAGVYCWGSGLGKSAVSDSWFAVLSFWVRLCRPVRGSSSSSVAGNLLGLSQSPDADSSNSRHASPLCKQLQGLGQGIV